jgi:hypothetical protein
MFAHPERPSSITTYAVVVPHRHGCPSRADYVRRRALVAGVASALLVLIVLALLVGARTALANRGDAPASVPAVRQPGAPGGAPIVPVDATTGATHLVLPGESLWTIASREHGEHSRREYLEMLIDLNGGTTVLVGQQLRLP